MEAINQQFENVSQAQFQVLCEKVRVETGVVITNNAGIAQDDKKKWKVSYTFYPETGDLSIEVVTAPWPDSLFPQKIAEQIKQLVTQALEG